MNDGPVNLETAMGQKLIFRPRSEDECQALQERLLDLGFAWADGFRTPRYIAECITYGLVLIEGNIYQRGDGDNTPYTYCRTEQAMPDYIPPDQRLMVDLFNRLSAKVDALSEKVDGLYAEIHPDVCDTKPGVRKPPAPGSGG